jgi:hypothetical protein
MLNFASMKQPYRKYLALFSLSLALGGCSKNSTPAPAIDFGLNDGYTGRNANWQLTSPVDPTDWTLDAAAWNGSETNLFAKYNLSFTNLATPTSLWQLTAHPNPVVLGAKNQLTAMTDKTMATPTGSGELRMAYVVVDANYAMQEWGDMSNINNNFGAIIKYDTSKFRANTMYRIYYVMFDDIDKKIYYKGHGDIKVTP